MSNGFDSFMDSTPFGGFFDSGSKSKKSGGAAVNNETGAYDSVTAPTFAPVQQQTASQQSASATNAGPSAYNDITTNPANTQAQTAQMAALGNLAANGGRNAASDANLAQIQQQENANAAGQMGAIQQGMASRGMGGSGSAMLAQLSAAQGAQNRQSAQDLGVRGQEASTALQAGQGAASIGSNLENQQFGEAAAKAQAQDTINRFNAGQGTQVSEFNAGQGNQVGEFNAGQGNQIGALNNYTMPQAQFTDSLDKAKGVAGANQNAATFDVGQQDRAAKKQGQLWNGAFDAASNTDTGSGALDFAQGLAKGGVVEPPFSRGPTPGLGESSVSGLGGLTKNAVAQPSNKEAMLSALGNLRKRGLGPKV